MKKALLIILALLITTMFVLTSCYEASFFDNSFEPSENNSSQDTAGHHSHSTKPGDTSFIEQDKTEADSTTSVKQETSALEETTPNKQDKTESDSTTSKEQETSRPAETTSQKPDKTPSDDEKVTMVWIPKTGAKYHSKPSCSNMKSPKQVTLESAQKQGYTACKRCH